MSTKLLVFAAEAPVLMTHGRIITSAALVEIQTRLNSTLLRAMLPVYNPSLGKKGSQRARISPRVASTMIQAKTSALTQILERRTTPVGVPRTRYSVRRRLLLAAQRQGRRKEIATIHSMTSWRLTKICRQCLQSFHLEKESCGTSMMFRDSTRLRQFSTD